jgi:hypothetical protein
LADFFALPDTALIPSDFVLPLDLRR